MLLLRTHSTNGPVSWAGTWLYMSFHPTASAAGLRAETFANARSASSLHACHLKDFHCCTLARWVGSMLSECSGPAAGVQMLFWVPRRSIVHPEPLLCVVNTRKGRGADRRLGGRARVVSTPSEVGERAYDTDEHHRYAQNIRAARELQVGCNSAGGTKIPVLLFAVKPIACTRALKGPGQAKLVYITHHTVNHTVGLNTLTVCLQASSVDLLVEFSTASSLIAHWLSCGWAVAPLGAG